MPPFWSFGFHQYRYGYNNTGEIQEVYNNYTTRNLPIYTFWADIYIFVLETNNISTLPSLVDIMYSEIFHFIPIVDLDFKIDKEDIYYNEGHKKMYF